MTHSSLTNGIQLTSDSSPRPGGIDRFIVHHAATTSLAAILSLFQPGGRTVSANYALGNDGTLILAVDENRRAWTSASAYWDGRAVTIEVANSSAGGSWPVSEASFDKLARLIADVSARYGFGINNDTILTHQELWLRYGDSYATACPGDLQRRKGELMGRANHYRAFPGGTPTPAPKPKTEEELMGEVLDQVKGHVTAEANSIRSAVRRDNRWRRFADTAGRTALGCRGSVLPLPAEPASANAVLAELAKLNPLIFPPDELNGSPVVLEPVAFFRLVDAYDDGGDHGYGEWVRNEYELNGGDTRMVRRLGQREESFSFPNRQHVWADLRPVTITVDGETVVDFTTVNGAKVAKTEDGQFVPLTPDQVLRADSQRANGQNWA